MTLRDLREFQELMFRAYVRNMMFLATLPYHMAQEMLRNRMRCFSAQERQKRSCS